MQKFRKYYSGYLASDWFLYSPQPYIRKMVKLYIFIYK